MTRGDQKGTLILAVKRGDEINVEYSKNEIINKINGHFGYQLISQIKLQTYNPEIKKNKGMIVFFSSSATILNDIGTSSYSSSKAGLETFARILSKELKTFKISVYIFRINYIKTRISENLKIKKIKNLLSKFKTNIFSNTDKIYYKILKLSEKKLKSKEILVSDKIKR